MVRASSSAWVVALAVAGLVVVFGHVQPAGEQLDGAAFRVADDQYIGVHRVQRQRGVDQRLALLDGAGLHGHVHHVRAQPFAGQFKARLRAGRGLEEHVDLGEPRQHVGVLGRLAVQVHIGFGQVQDPGNVLRLEMLDPQKVAVGKRHGPRLRSCSVTLIESVPGGGNTRPGRMVRFSRIAVFAAGEGG